MVTRAAFLCGMDCGLGDAKKVILFIVRCPLFINKLSLPYEHSEERMF